MTSPPVLRRDLSYPRRIFQRPIKQSQQVAVNFIHGICFQRMDVRIKVDFHFPTVRTFDQLSYCSSLQKSNLRPSDRLVAHVICYHRRLERDSELPHCWTPDCLAPRAQGGSYFVTRCPPHYLRCRFHCSGCLEDCHLDSALRRSLLYPCSSPTGYLGVEMCVLR